MRRARQFRYENVWQTHIEYDKLVNDNWLHGSGQQGLHGVLSALHTLQEKLTVWGADEFGCLARTVWKLRQRLDRLRKNSMGRGPSDEEKAITKKLKQALHREEIWMRQRSRVQWLREGDRNTSYFHRYAAQRKRINKIELLERADGAICVSSDDVNGEVQSFYQDLYRSQGCRGMEELLQFIHPRVTQQMSVGMDAVYTEDEIKIALFQMAPSKAPGLMVLPQDFFSDTGVY
jgi:hypothetical protein